MPRTKKRSMPVSQVPTGLPYGQHKQLVQQAAALPMGPQPAPAAVAPPAPRDPHMLMAQLPHITPLNAPTEHPGEPITTGMTLGAGGGPEMLAPMMRPNSGLTDMLHTLAQATGDPTFTEWAQIAQGDRNA